MADINIKHRHQMVSAEALALGSSAETLADAGATIPGNTGRIHVFCPTGDNLHAAPSETPTSSYGYAIAAGNWYVVEPGKHGTQFISDDGSDVTCVLVYERGSGRADGGGSVAASH